MEKLTVDTEGKVIIPPEVVSRFGLRPGNEVALAQTPESLIICDEGLAAAEEWWNSLTEEEKIEARKEADWYESLSEAEKDAIWNQDAAELEKWLEGDDDEDDDEENEDEEGVLIEPPPEQHPAR